MEEQATQFADFSDSLWSVFT